MANWLLTGDLAHHSRNTLANRRFVADKLLWFFSTRGITTCGLPELRDFMAYLVHGHEDAGGRWGSPRCTHPMKATSLQTYHGHLRTLFAWIVKEGALQTSPMAKIPTPVVRKDQVVPFSPAEIDQLISAARRSRQSKRNEALVLLMLDSGLRASEVCSLRRSDVDLESRVCRVVGKGNKLRQVPFGRVCAKALRNWLMGIEQQPGSPLFLAQQGHGAGGPLTRSGLLQVIERLGAAAGLQGARIGPHRLRHTFAIEFLRSGGNMLALQAMLGHESIAMTRRYVHVAQSDIIEQHREFSPADRLRGSLR